MNDQIVCAIDAVQRDQITEIEFKELSDVRMQEIFP
jgi:hypothetical protein